MSKRLVFVVGAGASAEVGLPVGSKLKTEIATLLDLKSDGFNLRSGDHMIWDALKLFAKDKGISDINMLRIKCVHIADSMPLAESIDNFIENNKDDMLLSVCAKLGISRAILFAERNSTLFQTAEERLPNFNRLENTWFVALFRKIVEQCDLRELEQRLQQLAFIVFNYDRCLETFLEIAISSYYQLSKEEARQILKHLEIYHPYGKLGETSQSQLGGGVAFGATGTSNDILLSASHIRTFTEGIDEDSSNILRIRELFREGEKICFLGFSFVPLNMKLLDTYGAVHERKTNTYIGTSLGLSDNTAQTIEVELGKTQRIRRHNLIELKDLTCRQLFHEYDRQLSLAT